MATIIKITTGAKAVYVDYDDGSQVEYPGGVEKFKQDVTAKADSLRKEAATLIALADGFKTEADPQKSPVIGKQVEVSVGDKVAAEGVK